jgi:molecular chaperone GrpE (heat shock protein)
LKEEKSKATDKIKNENPEEAINEIKVNRLKTQYESLQCEYVRKEKECEELTERMKSCLNECNETREKATNEALRKRADEMLKEIEENKIFIRELQHQVDMYREKFMKGILFIRFRDGILHHHHFL